MRALWLDRGALRLREDVGVPLAARGEVRVRLHTTAEGHIELRV